MSVSDNPLKIIPVNFGVKYNPPKIGLEYHLPNYPQIQYIYEIPLNEYLQKKLTIDEIINVIFNEH